MQQVLILVVAVSHVQGPCVSCFHQWQAYMRGAAELAEAKCFINLMRNL